MPKSTSFAEEDVSGLEVTVHEVLVSNCEGRQNLRTDVHHSGDRERLACLQRLPEAPAFEQLHGQVRIAISIRAESDAYDNALAETINGLYKTEVIRRRGPWKNVDAVEFATLEWVDWYNNRRLLEPIGYVPPAEYEAEHYRSQQSRVMAA